MSGPGAQKGFLLRLVAGALTQHKSIEIQADCIPLGALDGLKGLQEALGAPVLVSFEGGIFRLEVQ